MSPALSRRLRLLLVALLASLGAACPFGFSGSLVEESNAQVIVTGLVGDEVVRLIFPGERREASADGAGPLVLHLELPPGEHEGRVEIVPPDEDARCASVRLSIADERDEDAASVDARFAPACQSDVDAGPGDGGSNDAGPDGGDEDAGPGDAGDDEDAGPGDEDAGPGDAGDDEDAGPGGVIRVFVSFQETVTTSPCLEPLCDVVTTVESDGELLFLELTSPLLRGQLSEADLDALEANVLSSETDALFAGEDITCPQPPPGGPQEVILERRFVQIEDGEAEDVVEEIEVSGCQAGQARALRERLGLLRVLALGL